MRIIQKQQKRITSSLYSMFLDLDECSTSPCENSGTCVHEIDGCTCQCTDQCLGDNCTGIYKTNFKPSYSPSIKCKVSYRN